MKEHFKFLKDKINECIATRINIRDVHGSDMEAIAKRLDDNQQHANIAKAVGLFCSIGGSGSCATSKFPLFFLNQGEGFLNLRV